MSGNQLLAGVIAAAALMAGCGEFSGRAPDAAVGDIVAGTVEEIVGGGGGEETSREEGGSGREEPGTGEQPAVIYYDLTTFEWYRRGEPIVLEGRQYNPGKVEPTGERRFRKDGTYGGVDYYVHDGAEASPTQPYDTIYVPVYTGYWLAFTLDPAQAPSPAN